MESHTIATAQAGEVPSRRAAGATIEQLVGEHSGAVYGLARSILRDPGLSDDVTQETFIKVWKHLDEFRGDGAIRGWILRIAHREAISAIRRVRDTATDPDRLDNPADPITTDRLVEGHLAYDGFVEALDTLDDLSRAVLVLREVEGLTYDEIATVLDVAVPTVKTRLLRSRRRLSSLLEGWRS